MIASNASYKRAAIIAALVLILIASTVYMAKPVRAQAPSGSRVFVVGPVSLGASQSLTLSYSNIFSNRATSVRMFLLDASNGALVGGGKADIPVDAGKGVSQTFTPAAGTPVIGVVLLAEPRPDPLISFQVTGAGGVIDLLAEPRPDPVLIASPLL